MKVFIIKPWNGISYQEALAKQQQLNAQGDCGWLLFCCPPTITLGKQACEHDVLVSMDELKRKAVTVMPVDRGGLVTYHGPGQILGFPFGTLEAHTGDPRGVKMFIKKTEKMLADFIVSELNRFVYPMQVKTAENLEKTTGNLGKNSAGVWIQKNQSEPLQKIISIGMRFSKQGISHGFAFNVFPVGDMFKLIVPCGSRDARSGCLLEVLPQHFKVQIDQVVAHLKNFIEALDES